MNLPMIVGGFFLGCAVWCTSAGGGWQFLAVFLLVMGINLTISGRAQ